MTVTAVLDPRLGFPGTKDTQPVSRPDSSLGVASLLLGTSRQPRYIPLRFSRTPMPEGAFNVVQVRSGLIRYCIELEHPDPHRGWVNQMAGRPLDAYVVCGHIGGGGFRILPEQARTNSGLAAIYTRWPVISRGEVVNIGFYYRLVLFRIIDRRPVLGDSLMVQSSAGGHGYMFGDYSGTHLEYIDVRDANWRRLIHAARDGFDLNGQEVIDG